MKLKSITKRLANTMYTKLKTTDKLMRKQLISPMQKNVKASNKSKMNYMLVPSKTREKKSAEHPC